MDKDPFREYNRESEPSKRNKSYAWQTAIGLQAVDGLKTSEYLTHTAVRNIEGEISLEYLELFLRNLLLNEDHPLRNRTLHISGVFKKTTEPDIEMIKPDIEKDFRPKTSDHILRLREVFPGQTIFGRSDVMNAIGIRSSGASELLRAMMAHGIIEAVHGHGKGKYRFR